MRNYVDIILVALYVLTAVTVILAVWSAVHGMTARDAQLLPRERRLRYTAVYGSVGLSLVVMLATFLLGSSEPVVVNGQPFTNTFWLKVSDMFVNTAILLIIICFAIVAVAKFRRSTPRQQPTSRSCC
jgi:hypothetical protein